MDKLKNIFKGVEYAFIGLLLISVIKFIIDRVLGSQPLTIIGLYLGFFVVAIGLYLLLRNKMATWKKRYRLLFVLGISATIRLIVIYAIGVEQIGDYNVYLNVANSLANDLGFAAKYYGVFPHAIHYPMFMSVVFKLFGTGTFALHFVNILFSLIEATFVYFIFDGLFKSKKAVLYSLFVVLNPSSVFIVVLAGGELVYSAITVAGFYMIVRMYQSEEKKWLDYGIFALICGFANFFRPTGIILIIAFLIEELLFDSSTLKDRLKRAGLVLLIFLLCTTVASKLTTSKTGYDAPDKSYGWNLFVGANFYSFGQWNWEDADIITHEFSIKEDPSEIQTYFYDEAIIRYKNLIKDKRIVQHFANKFKMWINEDTIANLITEGQNEETRYFSKFSKSGYKALMTVYHSIVFLIAIIGLMYHKLTKCREPLMRMMSLYFMGTMCLFLLIEQAARYKGAYYGMLTTFAVATVVIFIETYKNKKVTNEKNI